MVRARPYVRRILFLPSVSLLVLLGACSAAVRSRSYPDPYHELHAAVRSQKIERMLSLIERGVDINSRDASSRTPLMIAASEGNKRILELLLDHGADVNLQDKLGYTALHWAAYYNESAGAEALIKRGASVNVENRDGFTPLILAAYYGHFGTVKALVEGGARMENEDKRGHTALDYARQGNFREVEEYLAAAGKSGGK